MTVYESESENRLLSESVAIETAAGRVSVEGAIECVRCRYWAGIGADRCSFHLFSEEWGQVR